MPDVPQPGPGGVGRGRGRGRATPGEARPSSTPSSPPSARRSDRTCVFFFTGVDRHPDPSHSILGRCVQQALSMHVRNYL